MEGILRLKSLEQANSSLLKRSILKGWSLLGAQGGPTASNDEVQVGSLFVEVDWQWIDFPSYLKSGENGITGEEKLKRIQAGKDAVFGANAFDLLWDDYLQRKSEGMLELLFGHHRIDFIDFLGSVLKRPNGDLYTPSLSRNDNGWHQDLLWLGDVQEWSGHTPVSLRVKQR